MSLLGPRITPNVRRGGHQPPGRPKELKRYAAKLLLWLSRMLIGHDHTVPDRSRLLPDEARMLAECWKLLTYKGKRLLRPPGGQVRSAVLAELQLPTREVNERPHRGP